MTIISETSSTAARSDALVPPTASDSPPRQISSAWLISWGLMKAGFSAAVAIGRDPSCSSCLGDHARALGTTPHAAPKFAIHLVQPLPVNILVQALENLRSPRSPHALLLVAMRDRRPPYREHLHLDDQLQVLRIRRRFRRRGIEKSPCLLGILWRIGAPMPDGAPLPPPSALDGTAPWQSLLRIRRAGPFGILRQVVELGDHRPADGRGQFLADLNPRALRTLAADLQFRRVGNFCFAHPSAQVHPAALLRGPLFIDALAHVGPDHIHIGPGWITPDSPDVTFNELPPENAGSSPPPLHRHTAANPTYFEGPATRHRPFYESTKRAFDIAFSLSALLATLPICLVAALLIKLYDRGPVFFGHRRESLHGKPFYCLKFRTMVRNADSLQKKLRDANQVDGPQFKIAHDPRITPIGRFLRKTNIDELPQFWNVLKGEMSVVGPRPSPFEENQLCPPWREARLSVRPGITGLWQVSRSRHRGAADFQEWIYYDTQYVERRSLLLDLRIILLTIKEMFGHGQ